MCGPMSEMEQRVYSAVYGFLTDKFCTMLLVAEPTSREILEILFEKVTDEPTKD